MNKVSEREYQNYIDWAKAATGNQVYPLSIAEGIQTGKVYTDSPLQVKAVLFWHYCGFAYLSGAPDKSFLQEIYDEFFLKEQERRFLLITDDPIVSDFYSSRQGIETGKRMEYRYEKPITDYQSFIDNNDFKIERIDSQILEKIKGRIIPSFSWDSDERFLEKGIGYVVIEGKEIAAVAFSAAVSSEEIDIGVETMEPFRGRGYAGALADRMCLEIRKMGKRPVWAHTEQNTISRKTAFGCGFAKYKVNTTIKRKSTQ